VRRIAREAAAGAALFAQALVAVAHDLCSND
jgi:hypothetical protein